MELHDPSVYETSARSGKRHEHSSENVSPALRERSADCRCHRQRNPPPARGPRTDCFGKLRQRSCARGRGLGVHEQICRGISRQALLRRMRVRRCRRKPGARPGQATVRRGARQRPAPCRIAGEHGGVRGSLAAGRHDSRPQPGARRASYARPSSELFRQDVQDRSLWRHQRNGNYRLRCAGKDSPSRNDRN